MQNSNIVEIIMLNTHKCPQEMILVNTTVVCNSLQDLNLYILTVVSNLRDFLTRGKYKHQIPVVMCVLMMKYLDLSRCSEGPERNKD